MIKEKVKRLILWMMSYPVISDYVVSILRKRLIKKYAGKVENPRLFWGPTPLINNKYYSQAMKDAGFISSTVATNFYSVYKKSDFDIYTDEVLSQTNLAEFYKQNFSEWILFDYALKNFDIFHISYEGLFLRNTRYWKMEAEIIQACNKKVVMIPYGGDAFMYSKMKNSSQQHAMLINYPLAARNEKRIEERFKYWQEKADFCLGGGMIDGFGRWDSLAPNGLVIDTNTWTAKKNYNMNNGRDGAVTVVHTPNHRGVKGTEFIVDAVEDLRSEGLQINLVLLENRKNDEVKQILTDEADILLEQLIMTGYGLSAIEGMTTGLPVISNLEDPNFRQLFSRYSFLNECPLVSASPETVKDTLRALVTNPGLRKSLGECGIAYTQKYHSMRTAEYLFGKIYARLWYGEKNDIISIYHPLMKTSYNNQTEVIVPPEIFVSKRNIGMES